MRGRRLAALAAVAMTFAAGCTYRLQDPAAQAACGPLRYTITPHGAGDDQVVAVQAAVERYGEVTGRDVVFEGLVDTPAVESARRDPAVVAIEFTWPDDAPSGMGFAEPTLADGVRTGGWIYLNPVLGRSPAGIVRRATLHELGHIGGLDHVDDRGELMNPSLPVDDYGPGDVVGLTHTHWSCGHEGPSPIPRLTALLAGTASAPAASGR